ncbi:serine/threonine-protein kinase [Plesiocystis pacifica SIR-1]|uniref:Serine/threonine-protein kinase n=1 Tax=Plesiocystis pacifica SIR-1 TaxID=391625 RepID=A6G9J9_9BACT|nr:serine/threonine-protein kinase [Plesiocystis pacifica]EDM77507.1 serine/threonine-protein kinase [Plesiocystis pacifica SIR-1]
MTDPRQTVAYTPSRPPAADPALGATLAPPTPAAEKADTHAETLFASGATDTIDFNGLRSDNPSTQPPTSGGATGTRGPATLGAVTVLPEVRVEGQRVTLVPRQQTRYASDAVLGRGGMGEVRLARDLDIGRPVALKRLLDEDNPHAVARFIDEVRTVGSLEHPNIVPIHDVGVDEDGALFFVMKYIEGETLGDVIEKLAKGDAEAHATYTIARRLDIFVSLLRALQYAHGQGLVHRDIKPENVMVGRYGEVVLMDWGIAHRMRTEARPSGASASPGRLGTIERASAETVDGAVVGTPQYMSPEQAAGAVSELDGRSDIYSAFVLLYELLTLEPYIPEGKNHVETLLSVQERPRPSAVDPAFAPHPAQAPIPSELRHFVVKGLERDVDARMADVEEVLWELARVRSGDFDVVCPITFIKHSSVQVSRVADRRPLATMIMAAFSTLMFLGGVAGWVAWAL